MATIIAHLITVCLLFLQARAVLSNDVSYELVATKRACNGGAKFKQYSSISACAKACNAASTMFQYSNTHPSETCYSGGCPCWCVKKATAQGTCTQGSYYSRNYKLYKIVKANPAINGGYASWSDWEPCSVTCAGGSQSRSRTCTAPVPQYGGSNCDGLGDSSETRKCNENACPVCSYNRTEYDAMTSFDNTMNNKVDGVDFETCKSMCDGNTKYTPNPQNKLPDGESCKYVKWWNRNGGLCSLYYNFEQTHAWHRCKEGNLYQRNC